MEDDAFLHKVVHFFNVFWPSLSKRLLLFKFHLATYNYFYDKNNIKLGIGTFDNYQHLIPFKSRCSLNEVD